MKTRMRPLIATTALVTLALSACGGDASGDDDGDHGELEVPLSWIKTAEFAGNYLDRKSVV